MSTPTWQGTNLSHFADPQVLSVCPPGRRVGCVGSESPGSPTKTGGTRLPKWTTRWSNLCIRILCKLEIMLGYVSCWFTAGDENEGSLEKHEHLGNAEYTELQRGIVFPTLRLGGGAKRNLVHQFGTGQLVSIQGIQGRVPRGWNHLPVLPGSKKALEIPFFETSIVDFPTAFRWSNPWVASCPHFPSHPWAEDLWHVSFRGVAITKWLRPNVVSYSVD